MKLVCQKTLLSVKADTEIAVVEMGMRGLGQIRGLCDIAKPDVAVVTNVGETHMAASGKYGKYCQSKK